jgi:hypothetical protein
MYLLEMVNLLQEFNVINITDEIYGRSVVCLYVCGCRYVYIHIYIVNKYTHSMQIYTYMIVCSIYSCMNLCIYKWMKYVSIYIYINIYIYIYIYIYTYVYTYTYMYIYTHIYIYIYVCMYIYMYIG